MIVSDYFAFIYIWNFCISFVLDTLKMLLVIIVFVILISFLLKTLRPYLDHGIVNARTFLNIIINVEV